MRTVEKLRAITCPEHGPGECYARDGEEDGGEIVDYHCSIKLDAYDRRSRPPLDLGEAVLGVECPEHGGEGLPCVIVPMEEGEMEFFCLARLRAGGGR